MKVMLMICILKCLSLRHVLLKTTARPSYFKKYYFKKMQIMPTLLNPLQSLNTHQPWLGHLLTFIHNCLSRSRRQSDRGDYQTNTAGYFYTGNTIPSSNWHIHDSFNSIHNNQVPYQYLNIILSHNANIFICSYAVSRRLQKIPIMLILSTNFLYLEKKVRKKKKERKENEDTRLKVKLIQTTPTDQVRSRKCVIQHFIQGFCPISV